MEAVEAVVAITKVGIEIGTTEGTGIGTTTREGTNIRTTEGIEIKTAKATAIRTNKEGIMVIRTTGGVVKIVVIKATAMISTIKTAKEIKEGMEASVQDSAA